jgi:ribosomal protein S18 acetylase RimI-like enzyme
MTVDFKIRPMVKKDRSVLKEMLGTIAEFSPEEQNVALELMDAYLKKGEISGYSHLVAQVEFSPAGYICYGPTPLTEGTWDVYWMAVAPDRQRLGIGRALLQAAEDNIMQADGRLILIETSSKSGYERTRKFYWSMAYELLARIPDFYSRGDDKLIFCKYMV